MLFTVFFTHHSSIIIHHFFFKRFPLEKLPV